MIERIKRLSSQVWIPLLVLTFGGITTVGLVAARPSLDTRKPQHRRPLVRVVEVTPHDVELRVRTQGTVVPRTESDLVAEVAGRIIGVSPSLASGGFLEPDEVLVTIDPSDYEIAAERTRAAIARTESQLHLANTALERQQRMAKRKVGSSADLDAARNAQRVAEADLRDARAALTQAERDLERTRVRVPFAGRVRTKHVDVGQYVNRGTPVARVYAVDYAEVRLPIPDREAAFVDLPVDYRGDSEGGATGPEVWLRARFAGQEYTWTGRIVRTEGELDPKTRMIHAVARVEDPYGRSEDPDRPPLAVGLFVDAEIRGRTIAQAISLPREAVRGRDEVVVVLDSGEIDVRRVEVLRREDDRILIASGLATGDRVVAGPLAVAVDGMAVRVFEDPNEERDAVFASESGDSGADTFARADARPEGSP